MGKVTGIEYVDHTQNFWYGCSKVSAGCKNCFAEREMKRFGKDFDTVQRSKTTFNDPLKWKEPARVLTCSWGDFFHEDVPIAWLDDAWEIIRSTPHLTYMILTKRPQLMAKRMPEDWGEGYPNVWLGVTIENENMMWRLIPLEEIPAVVRFVSAEPLLGPLKNLFYFSRSIDWIIAGGESGPGFRPAELDWFRNIRDQCKPGYSRISEPMAFWFKQLGGAGATRGGKLLDGVKYNELPKRKE